jgi:hypothetical protein
VSVFPITPQDGGDDLDLATAAVGAVLHVDVEDALEQPCPPDAARTALGALDLALGNGSLGDLSLMCRPLRQHQPSSSTKTPRRASSFISRVMIVCSSACSPSSVGASTSTNTGTPSAPYTPSSARY